MRVRQARTGESYVTALRQVLAQRPGRIPVVELVDLTALGARLGYTCRIAAFPDLIHRMEPRLVLERLRGELVESGSALSIMHAAALSGERPRFPDDDGASLHDLLPFLARVRAGHAGVAASGLLVAIDFEGTRGRELVLFSLQLMPRFVHVNRDPLLVVVPIDGVADPLLGGLAEVGP